MQAAPGLSRLHGLLPALAALLGGWPPLAAQSISIPNFSFESPVTGFVNTNIDSWQKEPKPASYQNSSGYTWDQLAGTFANTAPGKADHIDNLDGNQAAYLFAVPQVGIFQDYNSVDWQNLPPTHAFNAIYTPGESFSLTVGVNGGGGNMVEGATLLLALYYRDASGNMVTVAGSDVTYTAALFPTHTSLQDFQVTVPTVQPGDAWAGQNIGVLIYSDVTPALEGGYWDIDNVRLLAAPEPAAAGLLIAGLGTLLSVRFPRQRLPPSDRERPSAG